MGNKTIKTIKVNGVEVDVVACWDKDTPEGKYDFYDFYVNGECINEGEPHYGCEDGLMDAIEAHLEMQS